MFPDILIGLKGRGGSDKEEVRKLFFVEVDRGTEGISSRLIEKLTGYELYRQKGVFKKFGKYSNFTVLLQTSSEKRVKNIRKIFSSHIGTERVLITNALSVNEKSILHESIWLSSDWDTISIMKG